MSHNEEILVEKVRELENSKGAHRGTADILGEKRHLSEALSPDEARRKMAASTRRSFIIGGAAAALGVLGWRWMSDETKYSLLRGTLQFNERVSRGLYSNGRLSPEFSRSQITGARVNGFAGMSEGFDPADWKLTLRGSGQAGEKQITIDEIRSLPRTDMIVEFKCIEGWSTITHFGGVRFSDFAARYAPGNDSPYVGLVTPDNGYYVGWDIESMMHPQTLLCYEMDGMPLSIQHGAPLRLASPTKYGIKQIKRIGTIEFTHDRPRDYWAENGYDWYAGL